MLRIVTTRGGEHTRVNRLSYAENVDVLNVKQSISMYICRQVLRLLPNCQILKQASALR